MAKRKKTAKKKAAKKTVRKSTRSTKKKATRKKVAKKAVRKTTKKTAKKKAAAKKSSKKKTAKKKTAKKKTAKKKTAKKKITKKTSRKTTKKKSTKKKAGKKKTSKKKPSKKTTRKTSRKKTVKKKIAKKTVKKAAKKTGKKKVSKKKSVSSQPRKTSAKKTAKKPSERKATATTKTKTVTPKVQKTPPKTRISSKKIAVAQIRDIKPERHKKNIDAMKASTSSGDIHGIAPYKPNKGEEYMSPGMSAHFKDILLAWKRELMVEVDRTMDHMQDDAANFPDPTDRATQESEFSLELRTRDRERKLLKKINGSLEDLSVGDYGYCEHCGIEIGLRRLEARPTAGLCIDCKTLDEIREKQMGK